MRDWRHRLDVLDLLCIFLVVRQIHVGKDGILGNRTSISNVRFELLT